MSSTGKIVRSQKDGLYWPNGKLYKVVYRVEAQCQHCNRVNKHRVDDNDWNKLRCCDGCGIDYQLIH